MNKEYFGYNISKWYVDAEMTPGTKAEIGTEAEFKQLAALTSESGLFLGVVKVDGVVMQGACSVNHVGADFIDFGTVTNYGGSPTAFTGTITLENHKMYMVVNMTAIL